MASGKEGGGCQEAGSCLEGWRKTRQTSRGEKKGEQKE